MRKALAELAISDSEHPNTWLRDEDDWRIDVYESGLVLLRDASEHLCRRSNVTTDEALALWLLLQQGQRDEIRRRLSA